MRVKEFKQERNAINYRVLKARKAYLGLRIEDIAQETGLGRATVCAAMNGAETLNLQTLIKLAELLNMRVVVDFELIDKDLTVVAEART